MSEWQPAHTVPHNGDWFIAKFSDGQTNVMRYIESIPLSERLLNDARFQSRHVIVAWRKTTNAG